MIARLVSNAHCLTFWLLVAACFATPLAVLAGTVASNPSAAGELWQDSYRLELLARTVLYNACVALLSGALAIPVAVAAGRGGGAIHRALLVAMPVSLLLPSIMFEYGWKQALTHLGLFPAPQSGGDVLRCVWTLACWMWPIPAAVGALALRRTDPAILEHAAIDGALTRVTFRLLTAPMLVGVAIAFVLASQEFAVFEPSGISVVATEVRMVYETGAFSSPDNPIAQLRSGSIAGPSQPHRIAAAVITSLPLLTGTLLVTLVALVVGRRIVPDSDPHVHSGADAVRAGIGWVAAATVVMLLSVGTPVAALVWSLWPRFEPMRVWSQFQPQIVGSMTLAAATAGVSLILLRPLTRRRGFVVVLAMLCFVAGGQVLALAVIRIYNRAATWWIYDSAAVSVIAYVARFGWIMLLAASATWSGPWRALRDLAAADGASPEQTAWRVILPLAWPTVGAAALLVAVLTLTEVPATMLLQPLRPQPIVPMLMTWVHLQRYDAMIEGTLLLCGVVLVGALSIVALWSIALRKQWWRRLGAKGAT